MRNPRHAGRKSIIDDVQIEAIEERIQKGESISFLASEYGVSRQALYKRLRNKNRTYLLDYIVDDELCTRMEIDPKAEQIRIVNYAYKLSKCAFGANTKPEWEDYLAFLDKLFISYFCDDESDKLFLVCDDSCGIKYSMDNLEKLGQDKSTKLLLSKNDDEQIPKFEFSKKDLLNIRTDTDGYQMKSISRDRMFFVKSQAIMAGMLMDDWKVELIASDICRQLDIPCVVQKECVFLYAGRQFRGVYSDNFELDGLCFISFERLISCKGLSTRDDEFIRMNSIDKLKWCAKMLSDIGKISYDKTLKYMIDLALVDCLVGNVDRHTRNFGLFYNDNTGKYEIPLIFDNGMGLFEHDYYRDRYNSFEEAMRNVYISPYGEDPFEMYELLDSEFILHKLYPGLAGLEYMDIELSRFAREYMERMKSKWQK